MPYLHVESESIYIKRPLNTKSVDFESLCSSPAMNKFIPLLLASWALLTSASTITNQETPRGAPLTYIQRNQRVTVPGVPGAPQIVYNTYTTNLFFGLPPPAPKKQECDPYAVPECAAYNSSEPFCLVDPWYPEAEIQATLENDQLAAKKLADVADQSAQTLIEGLDEEEQNFDYSLYNGNQYDKGNWVSTTGGFVCPSKVIYGRPMRAVNAMGQWRIIVQYVNNLTQTQRIETCLINGGSCRTLVPCHQSRCLQKYSYQRLLSFDPCNPHQGLFVDIYKLPSACSCHIGK